MHGWDFEFVEVENWEVGIAFMGLANRFGSQSSCRRITLGVILMVVFASPYPACLLESHGRVCSFSSPCFLENSW